MRRSYKIVPPIRSVVLLLALAVMSVGAGISAHNRIGEVIVIVGGVAVFAVAASLSRKCRFAEAQARLDRCRRAATETRLRIVSEGGTC